ncbi:hypothetical protein [Microbulbifer sp. ALW1]|uniref:hypothetical protein n=1 Tax=Microbulbifer sp. (strain ALW1) TaxID=1516059 RepID=UPI001F3A83AF|nr:hypothetical protein [Microbulbifer sp. ALW1]
MQQLPEALDQLHRRATELQSALEAIQQSDRQWESYLLQPGFAHDAALALNQDFDTPFRLAGSLFALLDYSEGSELSDARQTLQIPGVLAVPGKVIALALSLNEAKGAFQQLTGNIKTCLSDRPTLERNERLRDALADAGHPRTHLRQSYRQILLCPLRPDAIALSWIKARKSIRKVTADWCEKKLIQLDPQGLDSGIQYQRQLLAGLHPSQHQLLRQVQVQSRPNLQVAEIFYDEVEVKGDVGITGKVTGERYRQVGYSVMPVLVESDGRLPEHTRVEHEPPVSRRRQRRDLKISTEPFLPALRVHLHTGN